jgi:hypothetical protein
VPAGRETHVSNSLTALVIVVSVMHVAVLGVWAAIRLWPTERARSTGDGARKRAPCVICGEPATHREYDGLDPDEQHNPHTGRPWSDDLTHYQPLCAAH